MKAKDDLITITARQATVLRYKNAGFSHRDIATRLGVSERTVDRDSAELAVLMGTGVDLEAERKEQKLYLNLAKRSLIHNLGKNNVPMTIGILKGVGVWQDHVKDDTNPPVDPDELAKLIKQALESPGDESSEVQPSAQGDAGPSPSEE